jgi:hypothetical protein
MPFVGSDSDVAAMIVASLKEVEREIRNEQRRDQQKKLDRARDEEERALWQLDKELSPAPIREALTAVGY